MTSTVKKQIKTKSVFSNQNIQTIDESLIAENETIENSVGEITVTPIITTKVNNNIENALDELILQFKYKNGEKVTLLQLYLSISLSQSFIHSLIGINPIE